MHGARKARLPYHSSPTTAHFATPPCQRNTHTHPPEVPSPHTHTCTGTHTHTLTNDSASYRKTWQKVLATHLTPPIFAFFAGEIFCLFLSSTYLLLCHWLLLPSTAKSRKSRKSQAAAAAAAAKAATKTG